MSGAVYDFAREAQRRALAGLEELPDGSHRCRDCKTVCDVSRFVGCPTCVLERRARQELEEAREHLAADWDRVLAPAPSWSWSRFSNEGWRSRCDPRAIEAAERWDPRGSQGLLMVGPTGVGKTSAIVAALHATRDRDLEALDSGRRPRALRLLWTTEAQLVAARRNHALGRGEAPLIRKATGAPLLIVDELGFAPGGPTIAMEILDARYSKGRPTALTAGLARAAIVEAYGAAFYRRAATGAVVVDLYAKERS